MRNFLVKCKEHKYQWFDSRYERCGVCYQYRYGDPKFNYEEVEKEKIKKKEKKVFYKESIEIKFEHVFQRIQNDLYEKIENGECFNFKFIEKITLANLLVKFNRTQVSKILGVSIRTVRNKINEYGLKEIQQNKSILR